jgi:hypothetical protein
MEGDQAAGDGDDAIGRRLFRIFMRRRCSGRPQAAVLADGVPARFEEAFNRQADAVNRAPLINLTIIVV